MSLASNFGFIGEWCGIGDLPPSGIKDIGFLYTTPVNDSVPARAIIELMDGQSSDEAPC
jgi:hypothetical protein